MLQGRMSRRFAAVLASLACGIMALAGAAHAEVTELRIAQQYGITYLPLMIMERYRLIEKHAKAAGLRELKVTWAKLPSGLTMNDALLAGAVDMATGGLPPPLLMWDKTRGSSDVKLICAISSMPLFLNTRAANVKTVADFSERNRIALAGVKTSNHAVLLAMAAEKAFGEGEHAKLDPITVAFSHPDGMVAMLSGNEIDSHFTAPPFQYQELERPGVHTVLNSYELLGGKSTFAVVYAAGKFRNANPKTYAAFLAGMKEAINILNKDRKAAAELYVEKQKGADVASTLKMLNDPDIEFTLTPRNVMKYADFMYKIGMIKTKPASWKDLFFSEAHDLPGS
jgi:NitT/TauT family transport system substrate-binding protein